MAPNGPSSFQQGDDTKEKKTPCTPLLRIKASIASLSRCWRAGQYNEELEQLANQRPVEKKYVHIPTHAASSFLKTATPRSMKRANEVL